MRDLEEQLIQEESRIPSSFMSACQVAFYNSPPDLKSALATSYHLLLGKTPPLPPLIMLQQTSPVGEQLSSAASPTPALSQSPQPKRQHPSPDLLESALQGGTTSETLGEPPSCKR